MSVFISNFVIPPDLSHLDGKLYTLINKKLMVMGFRNVQFELKTNSIYCLALSLLNI